MTRLAKLSEGQVIDGRLECLYHGWQFEGEGQCVKIPQVIFLVSMLVCMYVCMDGCMGGWGDLCMHPSTYACIVEGS